MSETLTQDQHDWASNFSGIDTRPGGARTGAADPHAASPAPGGAPGGGTPSDVRPSEIVAGASGVQYSTGENTAQADNAGQDFADGSRGAAQANQHDPNFSDLGSNPMQSPDLAHGGFALRYGIGFLCSVYQAPGWNALPDVGDYSKPQSAYLQAFAGMNQTQQYQNPTKAVIVSQITAWTRQLAGALPAGGQGELVVSFQGHGAHGSFFAVDAPAGELTTSELMGLARAAEGQRVSLTIVMDACFSGAAVPAFQDHAADAVDHQVDQNVEGRGQQSSPQNHQDAEHLRDQMAHARELILDSGAIASHGDTLDGLIQQIEATNTTADWDAAMAENATIIQLTEQMQRQFETNMNFGGLDQALLTQITNAYATLLSALRAIQPNTSFDYSAWTGSIGHFQDQVSDAANRIIRDLQAQAR